MKKTLLSLVTISAIATTGALADSATDIAELKAMMAQMNKRLAKLERENRQLKAKAAQKTKQSVKKHPVHYTKSEQSEKIAALEEKVEKIQKHTTVKSKAPVLKFSGKHYLGFVSDSAGANTETDFETRRNYLQVKAYFADDRSKSG